MLQGEGHRGDEYRGDCRHLPIRRAAPDPHPHPKCCWLTQHHSDLPPLGDVFAASQAPNAAARQGHESVDCVVMGESLAFVPFGQAPEVVAVGYAQVSSVLVQVARLAHRRP